MANPEPQSPILWAFGHPLSLIGLRHSSLGLCGYGVADSEEVLRLRVSASFVGCCLTQRSLAACSNHLSVGLLEHCPWCCLKRHGVQG